MLREWYQRVCCARYYDIDREQYDMEVGEKVRD